MLVEFAGGADLGDGFIDGDATHFGCACRDDALPTDAPLEDAGHLLYFAGQDDRQVLQPRYADAVKTHRMEQHDQPGPIDEPTNDTREHRDCDQMNPIDVSEPFDHMPSPRCSDGVGTVGTQPTEWPSMMQQAVTVKRGIRVFV